MYSTVYIKERKSSIPRFKTHITHFKYKQKLSQPLLEEGFFTHQPNKCLSPPALTANTTEYFKSNTKPRRIKSQKLSVTELRCAKTKLH